MLKFKMSFWLLSLSSFLFFGSFCIVLPIMPDYMRSFGADDFIGLHITFFTLAALISRPFSGKLTDNWGRVPVMMIGATVTAVMSFVYPFFLSVVPFLIIRFLHGFSTGFKPTGTSAYVTDIVPINLRGTGMGIFSFFGMTGMGIGNYVGGEMALVFDYPTIFAWSGSTALISIGILLGLKETLKEPKRFKFSMLKLSIHDIYEPSVIVPFVAMGLVTFSFGVALTLAPDFSGKVGIDNKGLFFVYFTITSLLSRVIGGAFSDRFGRRIVTMASMLFVAVGMFVIGSAPSSFQFLSGALIFGVGYGLASPSIFAWAADVSPEKVRGKAFATIFIALEFGIGVGAMLAGFLFGGDLSNIPLPFYLAGILSVISFVFLLFRK